MIDTKHILRKDFGRSSLDTLAQSGTRTGLDMDGMIMVSGRGVDIKGNKALLNRAKKKMITRSLVLALIDVAKEHGDGKMIKRFWNAYHCLDRVITGGDKLYGKYCKNRICIVCSGIRKADIMNRYHPELKQWESVYMLTLTTRSVKAEELNTRIDFMIKTLNKIIGKYKKRHQRDTGIKFMGIKSLECNFNPIAQTYNPHFHLLVSGQKVALRLEQEWLEYCTSTLAEQPGQHFRMVSDLERDLKEVIKYGGKIFTDPDMKKKLHSSDPKIYAAALYNIIHAFDGRKIFGRFGFNLPKPTFQKERKLILDHESWTFGLVDWMNDDHEEGLTGHLLPVDLDDLLKECFDKELQ